MEEIHKDVLKALNNLENKVSTNKIKNELFPEYANYDKILEALEDLENKGKVDVEEVQKGERVFRKWHLTEN